MDKGNPQQRSENTATVLVEIDRNLNTPQFIDPQLYETTINEDAPGGSEVLSINVQDDDTEVHFLGSKQDQHFCCVK